MEAVEQLLDFREGLVLYRRQPPGGGADSMASFSGISHCNLILGDLKKPSFDPTLTPPSEPDMTFVPTDGQL